MEQVNHPKVESTSGRGREQQRGARLCQSSTPALRRLARECGHGRPESQARTLHVPGTPNSLTLELAGDRLCLGSQKKFATPSPVSSTCHVIRTMKLTNQSSVPVYTIAGASTARPLPEWLARKRRRSLKHDPEYANRIELLQDFEFEEASQCIRVSEDGEWAMSTGEP